MVTALEITWDPSLDTELDQLRTVLQPLRFPAEARIFEQGEIGDRMLLIADGEVSSSLRLPDGTERVLSRSGPGDVVGEIALLAGVPRSASVTTVTPLHAWTLDRHGFDVLRWDPRRAAVTLIRRLVMLANARLRAPCTEHDHDPGRFAPITPPSWRSPAAELPALDYMSSLLCFARFPSVGDVEAVLHEAPIYAVERGEVLLEEGVRPDALLLVARGAVEVTVHRRDRLRRVRLAGPGRFVGHNGVLDDEASPVTARARERSIVLAFPRETIATFLDAPDRPARAFSAAVLEDLARAVREASRPMALTTENNAARSARP